MCHMFFRTDKKPIFATLSCKRSAEAQGEEKHVSEKKPKDVSYCVPRHMFDKITTKNNHFGIIICIFLPRTSDKKQLQKAHTKQNKNKL